LNHDIVSRNDVLKRRMFVRQLETGEKRRPSEFVRLSSPYWKSPFSFNEHINSIDEFLKGAFWMDWPFRGAFFNFKLPERTLLSEAQFRPA
jgi:hypothetical protein